MAAPNQGDLFDTYFRRADLNRDGRISGEEAVSFFQGSNLPDQVLAQIWMFSDQNRTGYLGRQEFYNALKLVTVAQTKRELTPEIVKAALYGPASAKIPPPQINLASTAVPQSTPAGGARPASQVGPVAPSAAQNLAFRGPSVTPNANMTQQYNQSPVSGPVSGVVARPGQGVGFQGHPVGGPQMGSNIPNSRGTSNVGGPSSGETSREILYGRGSSPLTNQIPLTSFPPQHPVTPSIPSSGSSVVQPRQHVLPNGVGPGLLFGGDAVSSTPQPRRDGLVRASSVGNIAVASTSVHVSSGTEPLSKHGSLEYKPNSLDEQSGGGHLQKTMPVQQVPGPSVSQSGRPVISPLGFSGHQPQPQWPRPSQTDLQNYAKVFMEVDTDKDGKITGAQAYNLFLSWRLPKEVIKQVWDLSDEDNDSNLSLREFCIALYLMERFREGCPLPAVLPSNIIPDFPANAQTTGGYGTAAWGQQPGLRPPQGMHAAAARPSGRPPGKPPLPAHAASTEDRLPPKPQRAKVPVVEKHLVDQLSEEEQKSLNLKFQEASDANKKVEELEKEIKEAKEKMEFYRVKMQEIVLYKSRCDNRLNEVSERAATDKREVEALAKKYEEKYKQTGDVASKLTIEEATFRDIQEKKMEMYQAIMKMEQGGSDEDLQIRADRVQSTLEDLVKSLSERCKKYGLRAKPSTLLELPFGWQPGIQAGAADWDEDWDKFLDEGFSFVKQLTVDVQNIAAPPKSKVKILKKEKTSATEGEFVAHASDAESKHFKLVTEDEHAVENEVAGIRKEEDGMARSPGGSPSARSFNGSPRDAPKENYFVQTLSSSASPDVRKSHSDLGAVDASFSEEKSFDVPRWGTFDANDDVDSAWGPSKEISIDRHKDDLFGHGGWTLPPIKTGSSNMDGFLPKKSLFDESVPSTPAESVLLKMSVFADSVPSTPLYSSPKKGAEDSGLPLSRFDSFRSNDSGFQPHENRLSRFDSIGSTRDFESQDVGSSFQQRDFSRFDSMQSSKDYDYGQRFSSFDDSDPFGGSGPFKSAFGNETPRGESDTFGYSGQFRSSLGVETPRSDVDPFRSVGSFSETPKGLGGDSDPFGFRSTWGDETPRRDEDPFGPFGSLDNETPRRESDYFGNSGSFRTSFDSETPRRDFDSFGFGGPFGSSQSNETPRRDSDAFGASESFNYSVGSETGKGGTDSWKAF